MEEPSASTNNEVLKKALLTPTLLKAASSASLFKPSSSSHYTPFSRILSSKENFPSNASYSKAQSAHLPLLTPSEKEMGMIALEHCYARPLNWKPESCFYQPTKILFMQQGIGKRKNSNPLTPSQDLDDSIDVEYVSAHGTDNYDRIKSIELMGECDQHVETTKAYQTDDDWEDSITKIYWSPIQTKVFNGMASILNSGQLAKLACAGAYHEPIQRRLLIDKSVKRVRQLFASISWDSRLTQWIHQLLLDHLSSAYLSEYLDILRTLKSKLPQLVDKMVFGPNSTSRIGPTSIENLYPLLKQPWDPSSSIASKLRKLPGNPIFIAVPSAPNTSSTGQFKRQTKFAEIFSNLATVVPVEVNIGNNAYRLTMPNCADQMLAATRAKVQEVRAEYSNRPIILIGFNAGAALALQVAQVETIYCVICMGFSVNTAEGRRGDPDDSLLELQCPVLFVIGQCANTTSQEDIEDLRERMRVENGLIVVGSADDYLRVNKKKKRAEGITQNIIDRIIVETVGEFISGLLLSPYPPQHRQSPTQVPTEPPSIKRTKIDRMRNNSNGSSLDSEPPSPTPKLTRPGRPPGSKMKNKLESKWAAQIAQGILSSRSPPSVAHPLTQPTLAKPPVNKPAEVMFPDPLLDHADLIKKPIISPKVDISESAIEILSDSSSEKGETAAKLQMMGMNRSILSSGSSIPNKIHTPQTQKHSSGIRVLESVTVNPPTNGKLGPRTGVDYSKLMNSGNPSMPKGLSNMLLMPDGKMKTICSSVKGTGGTPLVLPMSQRNKSNISQVPQTIKRGGTKYITSKKQLLGRRPPNYPSQKPSVIGSYGSTLPPPTNLTSQDIMDLPIIFADDNQMLTDNAELKQADVQVPVPKIIPPPKLPLSNPVGKFIFLNKQQPLLQTLTTPALRRPTLSVPVRSTASPVKYTKIIISRGLNNETKTTTNLAKISNVSPDVTIRRVDSSSVSTASLPEPVDLENKLVATAIPKPEYNLSTMKQEDDIEESIAKLEKSLEEMKRNAASFTNFEEEDDDDLDYIPPRSTKNDIE